MDEDSRSEDDTPIHMAFGENADIAPEASARKKSIMGGGMSFHPTQLKLHAFVSEKDFEQPDEEFLAKAKEVDELLALTQTDQDVGLVARKTMPVLLQGLRTWIATTKSKVDEMGNSMSLDARVDAERNLKLKFQSDYNEMRIKFENEQTENDRLTNELRIAADNLSRSRDAGRNAQNALNAMKDERDGLKDANRHLEKQLEEAQRELSAARTTIDGFKAQTLPDTAKQVADLDQKLSKAQRDLNAEKDAHKLTNKNLADAQNLSQKLAKDLDDEKKRAKDREDTLQRDLTKANVQLNKLSTVGPMHIPKENDEAAQKEIERLEGLLDTEKENNRKAQKELSDIKHDKKCVNCEKAMQAKKEAQAVAFEKDQNCNRLYEENKQLRDEWYEKQDQLTKLEDEFKQACSELLQFRNSGVALGGGQRQFQKEAPVATGDVLRSTSFPLFDPQNFSASNEQPSAPVTNPASILRKPRQESRVEFSEAHAMPRSSSEGQVPKETVLPNQKKNRSTDLRQEIFKRQSDDVSRHARRSENRDGSDIENELMDDLPLDDELRRPSSTASNESTSRNLNLEEWLIKQTQISDRAALTQECVVELITKLAEKGNDKAEGSMKLFTFDDSHPEKIQKWLMNVEQCRTTNNWNDEVTCRRVTGAFTGASFQWFEKFWKDNKGKSWSDYFKPAISILMARCLKRICAEK
ncbi:interaptin-like [Paramacrobiotus metropolitanus]|uniref:interaptin-like n=1 Tax=Paramacrobiotus metropolitanus TaxID=2943436 RepID=UPI0024463AF3|nr:interaptin-like [Paramacrobiotus metropolitanus]